MSEKLYSPAAERNADPLWHVLQSYLPHPSQEQSEQQGRQGAKVLEIASGSGQHSVNFCARHPNLTWQPSDKDQEALASIHAYRSEAPEDVQRRLKPAVALDVCAPLPQAITEQGASFDIILSANMIHISPWASCKGLFDVAAATLVPGSEGKVVLYGPFLMDDVATAESNIAFDQRLKTMCPDYGIRHLRDVSEVAAAAGFDLLANHEVPANNRVVVYGRKSP